MILQDSKADIYKEITLPQALGKSHLKKLTSTVISKLMHNKGIENDNFWQDLCSIMGTKSYVNDFEFYSKTLDDIILQNLKKCSGEGQSTIWQLTLNGKKWLYENNFKTYLDVFKSSSYDISVTVKYVRMVIYNKASVKSGIYFH